MACGFEYQRPDEEPRRCPRPATDGAERCVFHRTSDGRREDDVSQSDLRDAVCADLQSDDRRRYEYIGITVQSLDLSGLVIETDGIESLRFADVEVADTLDLSGSVVRTQIEFEGCDIGRLDAMDATVESDVLIADSRFGGDTATCLSFRRASVDGRLTIDDSLLDGSVEFSGCRINGWFDVDGVTFTGGAHFPNATLDRAQFVDATFERSVQWTNLEASRLTFEGVRFGPPPEFRGTTLGALRFRPSGDVECRLVDATIRAGHLADATDGRALYDFTDATLGEVDIDTDGRSMERHRFYRTQYEGFRFPDYRSVFREGRWSLHEYVGMSSVSADNTGLERTYMEAKRGASDVGDHESAAAFFVREMRYRRRRYAAHARDGSRSTVHRFDAALRWTTNVFLDAVAGFGERPQRTVLAAVGIVVASGLAYPAIGGLRTDGRLVTYGSAGVEALLTSLYFSVTTFTTLGPGDVEPAPGLSRVLTASEAFAGAFLVALFVFALGRRVSR